MTNNPYVFSPVEILSIRQETEIDWTFRVAFDAPVVGGQFLEVSLPGVGEAPISISDYGPGWLDLTIRRVGRVTDAVFKRAPGEALMVRGPYGNGFVPENFTGRKVVVVAGGTGLAPVRSLVRIFGLEGRHASAFELLAGFKSPADMLYRELFEQWQAAFPVHLTVDREAPGWPHLVGLIPSHLDRFDFSREAETEWIVVGPPMMMKFTTLALLEKGVPKERITVSFERNMSCGIGKCGHCKIDETYVCLEGPVFPYTKAEQLLD